jgi:murein DD-endopeptidase MepM/ murein hydrolase activator NlpD
MKARKANPIWIMRFFLFCLTLSLLWFPARMAAREVSPCGEGAELKLSAPVASQGSLLLVEFSNTKPLAEVKGEWNERTVPFWRENTTLEKALIGVDLEKDAGKYDLNVTAQTVDGEKLNCSAVIQVNKGHFATERLHVEKQFVEPNPEQAKRASEEWQRLREIFDQVSPERLWDGKFRMPLDGVSSGTNFGKRRILNGQPRSPHSGVDFPAPTGTHVHAAQSGKVVLAEELFMSGNTVVLDHGLGIYTFYGHLSSIDVKSGDSVETGQVLGKVGATGRVTGPHLHWGLTVEKARVNPLDIVKLFSRE